VIEFLGRYGRLGPLGGLLEVSKFNVGHLYCKRKRREGGRWEKVSKVVEFLRCYGRLGPLGGLLEVSKFKCQGPIDEEEGREGGRGR